MFREASPHARIVASATSDARSAGSRLGGAASWERVARRAREDGQLECVLQPGDRPISDGIRGGALLAVLHRTVRSARSSVLDTSFRRKERGQVDVLSNDGRWGLSTSILFICVGCS